MDRKEQVCNKVQDVQEEKVGNKEQKKLKGENSSNMRRNMTRIKRREISSRESIKSKKSRSRISRVS